jgi:hypothetical protein
MRAPNTTAIAVLAAGILGAYAWGSAYSASYSASPDSGQSYTQPAAPSAQSPGTQTPAASEPAEKIMPGKNSDTCARLDKNHDGFISKAEFKASGKPQKMFKSADVGHRGKLNMEECSKALSG